ncbi:MAG TPA: hypothetical protein VFQ27_11950 [Xanthobacteraceae bacterium]|nr:hypothetical protein [Xanthobacteraceae bacterium]
MDDAEREPPGAVDSADAKRRRPQQPVLDLKATELGSDPARDEAPAPEASAGPEPAAREEPPPREGADPRAEAPAQPATPPKAPRRAGRLLAAALAGAVAGAAAAFGTVWVSEFLPDRSAEAERIAALEAQVRALAARPVATPEAVQQAASRAAAGEQALRAAEALQERLARAEAALKAQQPAAAAGDRLDRLDQASQTLGRDLAALRQRLDEIAAAARRASETAQESAGSSNAAAASSAEEIATLGRRLAAVEEATRTLAAKAANPPSDRDRAARFAAAALALRSAVERGESYEAELAAVRPFVADPARLAPLQAAASSGIAGARELARELSRLIVQIRQSANNGEDSGGLIDRLQASASKLVRIRPIGEELPPEATDPLSAMEAKAARTDIAGALSDAEKLPAEIQAPLAVWIETARNRVAALDGARALAHESLAGLAAGTTALPGRP